MSSYCDLHGNILFPFFLDMSILYFASVKKLTWLVLLLSVCQQGFFLYLPPSRSLPASSVCLSAEFLPLLASIKKLTWLVLLLSVCQQGFFLYLPPSRSLPGLCFFCLSAGFLPLLASVKKLTWLVLLLSVCQQGFFLYLPPSRSLPGLCFFCLSVSRVSSSTCLRQEAYLACASSVCRSAGFLPLLASIKELTWLVLLLSVCQQGFFLYLPPSRSLPGLCFSVCLSAGFLPLLCLRQEAYLACASSVCLSEGFLPLLCLRQEAYLACASSVCLSEGFLPLLASIKKLTWLVLLLSLSAGFLPLLASIKELTWLVLLLSVCQQSFFLYLPPSRNLPGLCFFCLSVRRVSSSTCLHQEAYLACASSDSVSRVSSSTCLHQGTYLACASSVCLSAEFLPLLASIKELTWLVLLLLSVSRVSSSTCLRQGAYLACASSVCLSAGFLPLLASIKELTWLVLLLSVCQQSFFLYLPPSRSLPGLCFFCLSVSRVSSSTCLRQGAYPGLCFCLSVCQQGFFLYLPPSRSLPGLCFFCLSVRRVSSYTCLHQGAYLACASSVCLSEGFLPLLASIKELTWLVLLLSVCQQGFFLYLPPSRSLPGLCFFCLSVSRVSSSTCLHQGAYLACASSVCLSAGFLPLLASIKELTWLVLLLSVCQQSFFLYLPPSRSLPGLCFFCLSVSRVSSSTCLHQGAYLACASSVCLSAGFLPLLASIKELTWLVLLCLSAGFLPLLASVKELTWLVFLLSVCQQGFFLYLPPSRSLPGLCFFCLSVSRVSSSTCLHQGTYLACASSVCLSAEFLPLLASVKELTWLVLLLSVCQQGFFLYFPPSRSLPGLCFFCLSVSRVSSSTCLHQGAYLACASSVCLSAGFLPLLASIKELTWLVLLLSVCQQGFFLYLPPSRSLPGLCFFCLSVSRVSSSTCLRQGPYLA